MRVFLGLAGVVLLLAGCGGPDGPDKPSITLEFPPDHPEQFQAAADAQCTPYAKAAKLRGIEKHGDYDVAVFDCV